MTYYVNIQEIFLNTYYAQGIKDTEMKNKNKKETCFTE